MAQTKVKVYPPENKVADTQAPGTTSQQPDTPEITASPPPLTEQTGSATGGSASEFVRGMSIYYNYIRPHQGIEGLTPAQMAHIPIDFNGNRWQTMIALATRDVYKSRHATLLPESQQVP